MEILNFFLQIFYDSLMFYSFKFCIKYQYNSIVLYTIFAAIGIDPGIISSDLKRTNKTGKNNFYSISSDLWVNFSGQ